jgi:hypothetical protein
MRGAARNMLNVIVHRDVEKDQHQIAVKSGIRKGHYSLTQLDLNLPSTFTR